MHVRSAAVLVTTLLALTAVSGCDDYEAPAMRLAKLRAKVCGLSVQISSAVAEVVGGSLEQEFPIRPRPGADATGWKARIRLEDQSVLEVTRIAPIGIMRRLTLTLEQAVEERARPSMTLLLGPECRPVTARELIYDDEGRAQTIVEYSRDLDEEVARFPLNPPVPPGVDPGGVAVALVDSGLNYTLPRFARALARDQRGEILGYDFWDDDNRPYDGDVSRSPFFPIHHGTPVASVLVREAPRARLIPYRYPRPDMIRMTKVVEQAKVAGAKIIAMPLGSVHEAQWTAFRDAAAESPWDLFVVSAGNDGRDIDDNPVYPAAFDLWNMLVVTSSDLHGGLAPRSNWGETSVDLLVPAENIEVIDFEGSPGKSSGSSYAVPRVAALAARLLEENPDWHAPDLIEAIAKLAVPRPGVRLGFIPNPAAP